LSEFELFQKKAFKVDFDIHDSKYSKLYICNDIEKDTEEYQRQKLRKKRNRIRRIYLVRTRKIDF